MLLHAPQATSVFHPPSHSTNALIANFLLIFCPPAFKIDKMVFKTGSIETKPAYFQGPYFWPLVRVYKGKVV